MKAFWLDKHLMQWRAAISRDHKPQAVILNGPMGVGKKQLLHQIIADLFCRQAEGHCGTCQNCTIYRQGYHPDLIQVEPDKGVVKVKMIRELTEFFTSTPHCSDFKIAVINAADLMNKAAANSLLKVLEEPPARGILFLVTDVKHQLLPTIRSRCISLDVGVEAAEKVRLKDWLIEETSATAAEADKALALFDNQPFQALAGLKNDDLARFNSMLSALHAALTAQVSVVMAAKELSEYEVGDWALVQRFLAWHLKQHLRPTRGRDGSENDLIKLIKNSPKVPHVIIKMTDLINHVMLNLNTQVKNQLLIEAMIIEIKTALK